MSQLLKLKDATLAAFVVTSLLAAAVAAKCDPSLRCRNGGTLDQNVCKCYCPPNYHGRNCEVESSSICRNPGDCSDGYQCFEANQLGGYICTCQTGRCGWDCQNQDGEMMRQCNPNPCQNGGYCSNEVHWGPGGSEYCRIICKCRVGFGGKYCQIADPCRRNPCSYDSLAECFETSYAHSGRSCTVFNNRGDIESVFEEKDSLED